MKKKTKANQAVIISLISFLALFFNHKDRSPEENIKTNNLLGNTNGTGKINGTIFEDEEEEKDLTECRKGIEAEFEVVKPRNPMNDPKFLFLILSLNVTRIVRMLKTIPTLRTIHLWKISLTRIKLRK